MPDVIRQITYSDGDFTVRTIRNESQPVFKEIEPIPYKRLIDEYSLEKDKTVWEKLWFVIMHAPKLINIGYNIVKIIIAFNNFKKGIYMNNDKKTTVIGIIKMVVGALIAVLAIFGVKLPPDSSEVVIAAIVAVYTTIDMFLAFFTNKQDKEPEVNKQ